MAHEDVEIELRFPLENPQEVAKFLNENAELKSKDVFQKDTYYTPQHRDFLVVKHPFEWLRLRETERGATLNYKHFYPEDVLKTDYCDEFESRIDNIQALKKIFESLDFRELIVVEKIRNTWIFGDVEIVIDDVKGLGLFIELEATTHFDDPKKGREYLYSILKKLSAKVGEEDTRGYPFRVLEKKGYKF
jgi:adenylate cyclase class 2